MNMNSINQEYAVQFRELEFQRLKNNVLLTRQLLDYVMHSDLATHATDPEVGRVFFSQSVVRIQSFNETIPTVAEAQAWLDEITSSPKFGRKYQRPMRMVIRQQDSGKPWPAEWICDHEMGTDAVFITFCPGPLHLAALLYELAQVLRAKSYPYWPAQHDRPFRRVWLDLVSTYGTDSQKRELKQVFRALRLPYKAVRRSEYDGIS